VSERRAVRQRVWGEEENEAEHDQEQLREQVERGHDDPEPVERRPPHDAHERDQHDHTHPDDDVPGIAVERVDPEGAGEIVRQEQRRERDHDQVVEEERPPGHEAGQVV